MECIYSLEEIDKEAALFWQKARAFPVWAFHGSMGVGKTTFTAALGKTLQVEDEVNSPTFSLINKYVFHENGTPHVLYHCDLYRLQDEEEAMNAGIADLFEQENAHVIVEWPERIEGLLPAGTLDVFFTQEADGKRKIVY